MHMEIGVWARQLGPLEYMHHWPWTVGSFVKFQNAIFNAAQPGVGRVQVLGSKKGQKGSW